MIMHLDKTKWQDYFFDLCKLNAKQSKDPSTQVGSVIVRPNKTIAGMGWNGFPRGCCDSPELYNNREVKYQRIVHAEMNAIHNSQGPLEGCSLFSWPLPPCERCAPQIIQSGITAIYYLQSATQREDWLGSGELALGMFLECKIKVFEVRNA